MSVYAATMEAVRFTEEQNKLILAGNLRTEALAEKFGRPVRAIQRQRSLLKKLAAAEKP